MGVPAVSDKVLLTPAGTVSGRPALAPKPAHRGLGIRWTDYQLAFPPDPSGPSGGPPARPAPCRSFWGSLGPRAGPRSGHLAPPPAGSSSQAKAAAVAVRRPTRTHQPRHPTDPFPQEAAGRGYGLPPGSLHERRLPPPRWVLLWRKLPATHRRSRIGPSFRGRGRRMGQEPVMLTRTSAPWTPGTLPLTPAWRDDQPPPMGEGSGP